MLEACKFASTKGRVIHTKDVMLHEMFARIIKTMTLSPFFQGIRVSLTKDSQKRKSRGSIMNRPPRKLILFFCLYLLESPSHHAVHNEYTTQEGKEENVVGSLSKRGVGGALVRNKELLFPFPFFSFSLFLSLSPKENCHKFFFLKERVQRDQNKPENYFSQRTVSHHQNDSSFILSIRLHRKSSDPYKTQPFWRFKFSTKTFVGKYPPPLPGEKKKVLLALFLFPKDLLWIERSPGTI